jgi:hypothetical protein
VGRGRAIAVGRTKFVNAGSLRVGDALERYGKSRRPAIVQLSPRPRVVGGRGIGVQSLRGSRREVRLEERCVRNRCKVNDGSISPQRKPSRTLVMHWTTRAIQPRTRARSLSDSRAASPRPIVAIPNAWFRRKVSGGADNRAFACNETLWLARHRIQVSAAHHGSAARPNPVRPEVATHVIGTFRYLCLRSGQLSAGRSGRI